MSTRPAERHRRMCRRGRVLTALSVIHSPLPLLFLSPPRAPRPPCRSIDRSKPQLASRRDHRAHGRRGAGTLAATCTAPPARPPSCPCHCMPRKGSPLRGRVGARRSSAEISISGRFVRTAWMLDLSIWARACTSSPLPSPARIPSRHSLGTDYKPRARCYPVHDFQGKQRRRDGIQPLPCACCQLLGKVNSSMFIGPFQKVQYVGC